MLSQKEMLVLGHLRVNSRESVARMSRETGIPPATIFEIIYRLRKRKVIQRHVVLIDYAKLGFNLRSHIVIKCKDKAGLAEFLMKNNSVNGLYRVADSYDFLLEVILRNLADYEQFKEQLVGFGIEKMTEHFVIEEIKKEGAFS